MYAPEFKDLFNTMWESLYLNQRQEIIEHILYTTKANPKLSPQAQAKLDRYVDDILEGTKDALLDAIETAIP